MILLVGLGNPTPNSQDNRHNVGFKIIDVRVLSESLKSKDGQTRSVSVIQIDIQNMSDK